MNRLAGKIAVVTGAGGGLGREVALLYAAEGAKVVVSDIREDHAVKTAAMIRDAGGEAIALRTDVGDGEQVRALVATAEREYGGLNIMTANAGILGNASGLPFIELGDEDFWRVMNVNFGGVYHCFKHAAPAILRAGGGAMTASSSLAGHRAAPLLAAYGASKSAVSGLVRALALELFPAIRVNEVSPGGMATDILVLQDEERGGAAKVESTRPQGALIMEPGAVARAHLYLVCEDSAYVNGQTIFVDAGRSVRMAIG